MTILPVRLARGMMLVLMIQPIDDPHVDQIRIYRYITLSKYRTHGPHVKHHYFDLSSFELPNTNESIFLCTNNGVVTFPDDACVISLAPDYNSYRQVYVSKPIKVSKHIPNYGS